MNRFISITVNDVDDDYRTNRDCYDDRKEKVNLEGKIESQIKGEVSVHYGDGSGRRSVSPEPKLNRFLHRLIL